MLYIVGFVLVFIITCALQKRASAPNGFVVETSAQAASGIDHDGGLKDYMGIPYAAPLVENSEQFAAFHAGALGYIFDNLDHFGAKPTAKDKELFDLIASI